MKTNIELAREAGMDDYGIQWQTEQIDRFADLIESRYRERLLAGVGEPFRYWVDIGGTFTTLAGAEEWAEDVGTPVIALYTADTLAAERLKAKQANDAFMKLSDVNMEQLKIIGELRAKALAGEQAQAECERLREALRPFAVYGRHGSRDVEVAAAIDALMSRSQS